jgi:D-alanine-D-alanine ligase
VKRRRVAILFGGRSAEHEISCVSARSVIDALDPGRVEIVPIGITREGRWRILPGPPALPAETGVMPVVDDDVGASIELTGEAGAREMVRSDGTREPLDVAFPVLHGPMGTYRKRALGSTASATGPVEVNGLPFTCASAPLSGSMVKAEMLPWLAT